MFGPCLVMHFLVLFLVFSHLDEEERKALSSKDQTRLHIGAVSPGPLQIAVKRRDVDEGSGQIL